VPVADASSSRNRLSRVRSGRLALQDLHRAADNSVGRYRSVLPDTLS